VQMPGLSGFEVIEHVGIDQMPTVIFITAFEEHAVKAFEVHAVDYLLKPFDDDRLREAVAQARSRLASAREGDLHRRLTALLAECRVDALSPTRPEEYLTRLTVREDDRITFVDTQEVDWFEASGNNVRLHMPGRVCQVRCTLRSLIASLDRSQFIRIHRSTIVNLKRIKEVQPWMGGDYLAIMRDGTQLKVSRSYRQDLLGR